MQQPTMNSLGYLASLKLTLFGMLTLAAGVLLTYANPDAPAFWVALPLGVLSLNLIAALIVNPRFRCQPGLLAFHLCLLAVLLLASLGQLAFLKGRAEVLVGETFDANAVLVSRKGALHPWSRLESVDFAQGRFQVDYGPGLVRGRTRSELRLAGRAQGTGVVTVGDNLAFRDAGYRFYTTSNKGYAVVLTWIGDQGQVRTGAVHFPSYPANDWKQLNHWTTPTGQRLEFELHVASPPLDRAWVLDSATASGELTVTVPGKPGVTLPRGGSLQLAGGRLRFEQLRMWIGYEIFYHPFLAWLFAAALVGVFGMAWHFYVKLGYRSADTGSVLSSRGRRLC